MMNARILLVEDDPAGRLTATVLLEDAGFSVEAATSLAEGKRLLARERPYALVLLDQHLGDGLGVQLIPEVRARMPRSKVVLLSGDCSMLAMPELDGAFLKADDFGKLITMIQRLVA
jgi:DNA-binding response OmpR family regulator